MLLLLLPILTVVFGVVLYLGGVLLQGWLYNDVVRHLWIRALIGGAVLALFHTAWAASYQADPGRFDTLYNFKTETYEGEHDEFLSVRKVRDKEQKPVRQTRRGATNEFDGPDGRAWGRSDADGMVVAVLLTEKDKADPTRFNANLKKDGTFPKREEMRYEAEGGKRYMTEVSMGKVYRKRTLPYLSNLFANGLHFVVWALVLWLVLRFTLGNACAIAFVLWLVAMLAQPALFAQVM